MARVITRQKQHKSYSFLTSCVTQFIIQACCDGTKLQTRLHHAKVPLSSGLKCHFSLEKNKTKSPRRSFKYLKHGSPDVRQLVADIQLDLHYLMSRRLSSPLHITCLAPANNLAIFMYSGVLVSLLCPESLSLLSRGDFEKELVVSM